MAIGLQDLLVSPLRFRQLAGLVKPPRLLKHVRVNCHETDSEKGEQEKKDETEIILPLLAQFLVFAFSFIRDGQTVTGGSDIKFVKPPSSFCGALPFRHWTLFRLFCPFDFFGWYS